MLGEHLRTLRKRKGFSVAKVIDALGVPRSTAYHWEGPSSRPDPVDLKRLLDLYEATADDKLRAYELRGMPVEQAA